MLCSIAVIMFYIIYCLLSSSIIKVDMRDLDGNSTLKFLLNRQTLVLQPMEELAPLDQSLEKEHEEKTKVKNIQVCSYSSSSE